MAAHLGKSTLDKHWIKMTCKIAPKKKMDMACLQFLSVSSKGHMRRKIKFAKSASISNKSFQNSYLESLLRRGDILQVFLLIALI